MQEQYSNRREDRIAKATIRNKTNPVRRKEILKKYSKIGAYNLSDEYVRRQIHKTSNIPYLEIPQSLIDVTRELMRIKRYLKGENEKR
jgi:hypothetical protein